VFNPLVHVCLNWELYNPNIGSVISAQKYQSHDLCSILSLFLKQKLVSDGDEEQQKKTLFHCFTCCSCMCIGIVSCALVIPYTFINIYFFRYDSDLQ